MVSLAKRITTSVLALSLLMSVTSCADGAASKEIDKADTSAISSVVTTDADDGTVTESVTSTSPHVFYEQPKVEAAELFAGSYRHRIVRVCNECNETVEDYLSCGFQNPECKGGCLRYESKK